MIVDDALNSALAAAEKGDAAPLIALVTERPNLPGYEETEHVLASANRGDAGFLVEKMARRRYLAEHTEPESIDFRCPVCKVAPGEPCVIRGGPRDRDTHLSRADRMIEARRKRNLRAYRAADVIENRYLATRGAR